MISPIWIYKVRRLKGLYSEEKVVRIPPEVADQLGEYVKITVVDGKLVIEPYEKTTSQNSGSEV